MLFILTLSSHAFCLSNLFLVWGWINCYFDWTCPLMFGGILLTCSFARSTTEFLDREGFLDCVLGFSSTCDLLDLGEFDEQLCNVICGALHDVFIMDLGSCPGWLSMWVSFRWLSILMKRIKCIASGLFFPLSTFSSLGLLFLVDFLPTLITFFFHCFFLRNFYGIWGLQSPFIPTTSSFSWDRWLIWMHSFSKLLLSIVSFKFSIPFLHLIPIGYHDLGRVLLITSLGRLRVVE